MTCLLFGGTILGEGYRISRPAGVEDKPAGDKMSWADWLIVIGGGEKPKGRSSLTKWECGCNPPQRARIGKAEFYATCDICGLPFTRKT
jgi:hypothetical protein